ncbi:MAG TPA: hypothetical protein VHB21_21830, partial [Minicystis sp.]|nr:hypothetical protein [Minicystis sp.]
MEWARLVPLFALALFGCGGNTDNGSPADAGTPAAASASAGTPEPAPQAADAAAALPRAELTVRVTGAAALREPLLAAHLPNVREHFAPDGGALPPLELQIVRLPSTLPRTPPARTAVLVTSGAAAPLLLAIDAADERGGARGEASSIAWSKERPLAGTFPGATEIALLGGPNGEVALAWWDPTTRLVALRRFRFDGVVEADFVLGPLDACDAMSAVYWPGHGFLAIASNLGTGRAFLLGESGTLRWAKGGVDVGFGREARAPITPVPDAERGVVLVGVGTAVNGGRRAREHVLATRLDDDGAKLWDAPVDVGPAPPRLDRVDARPAGPGLVSV